jgi:transposase InsO family protein
VVESCTIEAGQRDIALGDRIEVLHRKSRGNYGRPRLQADLRDEGIHMSDRRVARLMRERNIQGATRRKGFTTTIRDRDARPAPDPSTETLPQHWLVFCSSLSCSMPLAGALSVG